MEATKNGFILCSSASTQDGYAEKAVGEYRKRMQAVYKACCSLQAWDGMKPCLSSIHAGLCARNELPLPACCVPGFCPSAAIISPTFHSSLVLHVVILQWVIMASGCPPCACPVSVHQAAAAYPPCPLHQLQRSNPVKPGCKNHHSIA